MDDRTQDLSLAGRLRRETMRDDLRRRFMRHHRQQRWGRGAALAAGLVVVAALAHVARPRALPMVVHEPAGPPAVRAVADVRIVRTDPAALDRYAYQPEAIVPGLDDDGLIAMLSELESQPGLARRGDRVWLVTNP